MATSITPAGPASATTGSGDLRRRSTLRLVAAVDRNLARVRATADWLETAVNTGEVSFDEGLATMLRGD
jgi:hypothetical protein